MAIRASAGRILMFLRNRPTATPPIMFQNFDNTSNFSLSIWLKPSPTTTSEDMFGYMGDGNTMRLEFNARKWYLTMISATGVRLSSTFLADVSPPRFPFEGLWQVFCISKVGSNIKVYVGNSLEGSDINSRVPVITTLVADFDVSLTFPFFQIYLGPSHELSMCNFKYWNSSLTKAQFDEQANEWNPIAPSGGPLPVWCSTLRSPGDISNIANPSASANWNAGHLYEIDPNLEDTSKFPNNFQFDVFDPPYLGNLSPCSVWVPILTTVGRNTQVTFNPGNVPANPTTYKSTEFLQFEDRGAIVLGLHSTTTLTITYYAFAFATGSGHPQNDSYPLIHDDTGTEVVTPIDPAHRFEQDTGVDISGLPGMNDRIIFFWRYGGQFTWQPQPGGGAAATATLGYAKLLVTNVGFPAGVATQLPDDLTGLFILRKDGIVADTYNLGAILKIPDPTVRTAFIGE